MKKVLRAHEIRTHADDWYHREAAGLQRREACHAARAATSVPMASATDVGATVERDRCGFRLHLGGQHLLSGRLYAQDGPMHDLRTMRDPGDLGSRGHRTGSTLILAGLGGPRRSEHEEGKHHRSRRGPGGSREAQAPESVSKRHSRRFPGARDVLGWSDRISDIMDGRLRATLIWLNSGRGV